MDEETKTTHRVVYAFDDILLQVDVPSDEEWQGANDEVSVSEDQFMEANRELWIRLRDGEVPKCRADLKCGITEPLRGFVFMRASHPCFRIGLAHGWIPLGNRPPPREDALMKEPVERCEDILDYAWSFYDKASSVLLETQ